MMDLLTIQEGTDNGDLPFRHSLGITGSHLRKPQSWTAGNLPQHKLVNGVWVDLLSFFSSSESQMSHVTESFRHCFDVPLCKEKNFPGVESPDKRATQCLTVSLTGIEEQGSAK